LNWKVWLGTSLAVTVAVITSWVLYDRLAVRQPAEPAEGADDFGDLLA